MANKVGATINRIQLDNISIEGIEELEMGIVARQVEERIKKIEAETGYVDTIKLSLLAAMSFAAETYLMKQDSETSSSHGKKIVDSMIHQLESALERK